MDGSPFPSDKVEMEATIAVWEEALHCPHPCSRIRYTIPNNVYVTDWPMAVTSKTTT